MPEAKQYVALEDFKFRGVDRKKGDVFRVVDHKVAMLGDKIKLVDIEQTATTPLSPKIMSQYKVKEAFELDGMNQEVDSVIELSDEKAAELGEKVEKIETTDGGSQEGNQA